MNEISIMPCHVEPRDKHEAELRKEFHYKDKYGDAWNREKPRARKLDPALDRYFSISCEYLYFNYYQKPYENIDLKLNFLFDVLLKLH